jgi:hypothetical protein
MGFSLWFWGTAAEHRAVVSNLLSAAFGRAGIHLMPRQRVSSAAFSVALGRMPADVFF